MRTLKNGKDVKYYTICPECASHLEYDYDDVQKAGGSELGSRYIICPVCGERIKTPSPMQFPTSYTSLAQGISTLNCACK